MAKNVVVCCDGTANEFATDHTNVLKCFACWTTIQAGRLLSIIPVLVRWKPSVR